MGLIANANMIGWILIASGIVFILSFIFLALMFSTKRSPWGPMNDVSYVIALVLIIPALLGFYMDLRSDFPAASLTAAGLGITGILIITVTQMRLVFRNIAFDLNLRQGAFGSGLLGIAFIVLHLLVAKNEMITAGIRWLGLASGFLLAFGIPTGLFYGKEELAMTTGELDWKSANKLAILSIMGAFIGQVGLIAWVFWLGIFLISL